MTNTRRRIREEIESNPGVHFNALVRELSLATGQVQYHLHRLVDADEVVRHERYGRTHLFPPGYDEWERDALSVLRRETDGAIAAAIYANEPARPDEVADTLDLPRSTLEHHLDHLESCGVVVRRRTTGNRVLLELARPSETVALLEATSPDPKARLIDRFERLVDSLFDERA